MMMLVQILPLTHVAAHHYGDCIEGLCILNGDGGTGTGVRVQWVRCLSCSWIGYLGTELGANEIVSYLVSYYAKGIWTLFTTV